MDEHNSEEEQFYNNSPITFDDFKDFSSVNESSDDQAGSNKNQNNEQLNFSPQLNPITEKSNRDNIMNQNEIQMQNDDNFLQQQQQFQPVIDEDMFQQFESNESFQSNSSQIQSGLNVEKKKSQLSTNQVLNEKIQEQLNKIESRQSQQINWAPNDIFLKKQNSQQRKDFDSNFEANIEQLISHESEKQRIEKSLSESIQKKISGEIGSQSEMKTSQGIQARKMSNQELFQVKNKNEQFNELEQQIQKYQDIQQQIERKRKSSSLKFQPQQQGIESDPQKSIPQSLLQQQIIIEQEKIKPQQQQFERKIQQGSNQQTEQYFQQQLQYQQQQNSKIQQQIQQPLQILQQQNQQYQQIQQQQQQPQLQQQQLQHIQQQQYIQQQNLMQQQQQNQQKQQIQQPQSIQLQQKILQQQQIQQQQQQIQQQQSQQIEQAQQIQQKQQFQQQQQLKQQQQQILQQQQIQQQLKQQQQQQTQKLNQNSYLDENNEQNYQIDKRQIENNTQKFKIQWDSALKDSKVNSEFKKNTAQKSIEKQLKQLENQQNIYKQIIQNQQQHEMNEKNYYSKHIDVFCNALGYDRSNSQSPQKYEQIKDKLLIQSGNINGNTQNTNIYQNSQINHKDLTQKFKENWQQQMHQHQEGKNDNRNLLTFANHQSTDGGPLQMADINSNSLTFNNNTKNNAIQSNSRILNSNQSSNTLNQQQQNLYNDQLLHKNMIERIDNQFSLSNDRQDFNQSNNSENLQEENILGKNSHLLNSNSIYQNSNQQQQQSEQDIRLNLQCQIHPEEQNLFYCVSCKQFNICLVCLHSGLHSNHQVIDLQQEIIQCNSFNVNSYFINKLVSFIKLQKERKTQILGKQDVITQNQKRIMNQQDELILFVQNKLQEIRMNIDNYEKKIHNDINKVFTNWFEKFCADQDKFQELADELQNECDFFEAAFSQQQNQLSNSQSGNIQVPTIPPTIIIYANNIDKIECVLQEDDPLSKTIDLNISSLENNMTERNNLELANIAESLEKLTIKIQKSMNKYEKVPIVGNQNVFNTKFEFESIQQQNRSKSPQLDTFRKSPIHSKQQQKMPNQLNDKKSALKEQFYNHLYPNNLSPLQKQRDIFNLERRLDDHFMSQSPTRFEGQNISQHSLSVNSMFGKSTNSTNNNPNFFQSTSLLAKHNYSQKNQDNLSHRKSLSHRKIDVGLSQNKNYETLQRIKQNLDQVSISPHSSQKKIQLKHTNNLFNHIASSNGINPSNGSLLKRNQNFGNETLKNKFFSNTQNLSTISNNSTITQNLKRQNLRNRKSDIDLNNMKSGYEDYRNSSKFLNSLIPSSTQSQLLSPQRLARVENPQVSHRNHQTPLQKNMPITIDQQYSCSKMMSNLIKYKQLYNKGKRSFFDQSSNAESTASNNFS